MLKRVCERAINMPTIFSLLLVFVFSSASPVSATTGAADLHYNCHEKYGYPACFGYPVRSEIQIYSHPSESGISIASATFGSKLMLIDVEEKEEAKGWIPVYLLGNNGEVVAWVRHDDIVVNTDLSRVVGCWPVKSISWIEEGEDEDDDGKSTVKFSVEGDAKLQPEWIPRDYAVYYSRGVFLVRYLDNLLDEHLIIPNFFLDIENGNVFVSAENPSFELFSDEALAGCEQIPQTDSSQKIMFK